MNAAFFLLAQGPSQETAQWRWLTWGSAFAAIGWVVVSDYSRYAAPFAKLQQNLRVIRRRDQLDDVEVAFFRRHFARSRAQRLDGAPHSIRHDAGVPVRPKGARNGCRTQSGEKTIGWAAARSQHIIIKPRT